METRNLLLSGVYARVLVAGSGAPLLMLHGWGGRAESMAPITEALSRKYTVYAPDFPGFGGSEIPKTAWNVDDYRDFVLALMEKLDIPRADIVAHSFGCRVAIDLAAHCPEKVGRMVLTGAAGLIPRRTLAYYVKVYTHKLGKKLGLKSKNVGSADYRALPETMKGTFVKVVNQDLRPLLPRVAAPTLLVFGDQDQETPVAFGRIMEKEMPHARLEIYPGLGHFAYLDRKEDFSAMALRHLEDA